MHHLIVVVVVVVVVVVGCCYRACADDADDDLDYNDYDDDDGMLTLCTATREGATESSAPGISILTCTIPLGRHLPARVRNRPLRQQPLSATKSRRIPTGSTTLSSYNLTRPSSRPRRISASRYGGLRDKIRPRRSASTTTMSRCSPRRTRTPTGWPVEGWTARSIFGTCMGKARH